MQDRQGLAEAAGLKPVVLDIESHASRLAMSRLIEALPNEGRDALVALFEIGADHHQPARCCATTKCCTTATRLSAARS